jgi:hypothetical protein
MHARSCGTCSLCCKLPYVAELNKPINTWAHTPGPATAVARYMRIGRPSVGFSFALAGLDQRRGDALRNDPGQQGLGYDLRPVVAAQECRRAALGAPGKSIAYTIYLSRWKRRANRGLTKSPAISISALNPSR